MTDRRTVLAGLVSLPLLSTRGMAVPVARIERIDSALDRIVDPSSPIEILANGFRWAEGPVWVPGQDCLIFTDPPANIAWRWKQGEGAKPFLSPAGYQGKVPPGVREAGLNGLAIDAKGTLVAADSGTRAIVRIDLHTRRRTILADRFQGKRFNSPNDLCIAPSGTIYFTDPPYGLTDGDTSPLRELDHNGLYRLTSDGDVTLLDGQHRRPNGVALSPDGRTLYLALSDEERPEVVAYDLDANGLPVGQRQFRDMRPQHVEGRPGLPDGIKVAPDGHVFATGPGGVHVCSAQGALLGIIATGKAIANCCIDAKGGYLYLTSSAMLARVALKPAG
ncbi:SMP-30/gluconolactonase/LRE family protein [Sphingobium sp.]|uniref:SMP-30/gluconolactonase/LRE family protein n=1 Tax=Sphingobium sp. TaxID=1912891 RepID=UPI002CEA642F|nr:SMP-30/gluconolactonase/LRE family protein [Sphingobium sp.]HUD91091.1 SMP-30/gluconolactonase/LRE family protein [Sphingobium sp.]